MALLVNGFGALAIGAIFYLAHWLQWTPTKAIGVYSLGMFFFNATLFACTAFAVHQSTRRDENQLPLLGGSDSASSFAT